eukprot:6816784-Pyramimonas_sp.AAC.1
MNSHGEAAQTPAMCARYATCSKCATCSRRARCTACATRTEATMIARDRAEDKCDLPAIRAETKLK